MASGKSRSQFPLGDITIRVPIPRIIRAPSTPLPSSWVSPTGSIQDITDSGTVGTGVGVVGTKGVGGVGGTDDSQMEKSVMALSAQEPAMRTEVMLSHQTPSVDY